MDEQVNGWRLATSSDGCVRWLLRRNCSVTPRQMGFLFLSLCLVSLVVSLFFWSRGATLVLPFAALELMAVGAALLVFARHATDQECITCAQGRLVVEQESAGLLRRSEFARHAVQVDVDIHGERLVALRGDVETVRVGRYLRADLRPLLAKELRRALRGGG